MGVSIVLTSTVLAAIVAGAISGLILLWNSRLERKARKEARLWDTSYKLASGRADFLYKLAIETKRPVEFKDTICAIETYYVWLKELEITGKLPEEAHGKKKND